jgi:SacI homology domain
MAAAAQSTPTLEPYVGKLERFELFSTNQCYYLVACNRSNSAYRVLKMDRTLIERNSAGGSNSNNNPSSKSSRRNNAQNDYASAPSSSSHISPPTAANITNNKNSSAIPDASLSPTEGSNSNNNHAAKPTLRPLSDFLTEDPNVYTQAEIKDMLDMIHAGNRVMLRHANDTASLDFSNSNKGGLKPIVKAYGIVGFVRFLDCYYLTLITRRAKVGSIGDHGIYTIKVCARMYLNCIAACEIWQAMWPFVLTPFLRPWL